MKPGKEQLKLGLAVEDTPPVEPSVDKREVEAEPKSGPTREELEAIRRRREEIDERARERHFGHAP